MESTRMVELDIRGQVCPSTLLTTLREVNRHQKEIREGGLQLLVRTDNRDATVTLPQAAANMGLSVEVCKEDGCYLISIGKGQEGRL